MMISSGRTADSTTWKIFLKNGRYYLSTFEEITKTEADTIMTETRLVVKQLLGMTAQELLDLVDEEDAERQKQIKEYHEDEWRAGIL